MHTRAFLTDIYRLTFHCATQVKETAQNVDVAVRELPDANKVSKKIVYG